MRPHGPWREYIRVHGNPRWEWEWELNEMKRERNGVRRAASGVWPPHLASFAKGGLCAVD